MEQPEAARVLVRRPNFEVMNGLVPAVIQDHATNDVLMVGYVNPAAWELILSRGQVHYYSRKKRRIWLKGEQSGHYQLVKEIFLNCDNTCLLVKVEQIGGACDTGLRSCFDKVLKGNTFESTGVTVFDPAAVYAEKFTEEIHLGIPSGSLAKMTFQLIHLAGYQVERPSDRSYHPKVVGPHALELFMARAQELPYLVAQGILDAALTGMDLVEEAEVSIRDICGLGYNKLGSGPVILALGVPTQTTINSLGDLDGKRIATTYENLTRKFFAERGVSVHIVPSVGATEGKVPLLADAVVELVETGATFDANHLKPVLKLFETSVHLIANNESWGYTWKRRRLEEIASRLVSVARDLPHCPNTTIALSSSVRVERTPGL